MNSARHARCRAGLAGAVLGLASVLAACGDGGGGSGGSASSGTATVTPPATGTTSTSPSTPTSPASTAPTAADFAAARFLQQATFGATKADIARVESLGVVGWLDEQMRLSPSLHQDRCQGFDQQAFDIRGRNETFWERALTAPDQLRQRVAYALSHQFVVSDQSSALTNAQVGLCGYYDILLRDGLGNYRQLLEDVTLSPVMGRYLSMLNSARPDASSGRRADENYARESMQLFALGLNRLNPDGTVVRDAAGQPVTTYTQADVENLARVFTGWSWGDAKKFGAGSGSFLVPMQAFPAQHDTGAKTLVGGVAVPAGGTPEADLRLALDTLFNHPNAGPFLATHLIQALVTSNPSPAYVGRVAAVFANDGQGTRGNLAAVVRAVLTDDEALNGAANAPTTFGRAREPILKVAQLWRAFDGHTGNNTYAFWYGQTAILQAPLGAPSVFDYYSPGFSPAGIVRDAGLLAPETQMATSASVAVWDNFLLAATTYDVQGGSAPAADMQIDLGAEATRAATDMNGVLDDYNLLLLGGRMSDTMRQALLDAVGALPASQGRQRAAETLYLVTASPQFAVQR